MTKTETFKIDGMSCGHCVRAVDQALRQMRGVEVDGVEIGAANVRYDSDAVTREQIAHAIEDEGYTVQ